MAVEPAGHLMVINSKQAVLETLAMVGAGQGLYMMHMLMQIVL